MSKWRKGPPFSIGWWPARVRDTAYTDMLGWWDGSWWSVFAHESDTREQAAATAQSPGANYPNDIEWTDRPAHWPERSKT